MSDWLAGQFRNSYLTGVLGTPSTRTGRFLSDTRCSLDSQRHRKLLNSALRLESSGDAVPHNSWRNKAWVGDPTGKPISVELACVLREQNSTV